MSPGSHRRRRCRWFGSAARTISVGGAGNVALNLAGLGVHADVAGWTGDDDAGARLRELLGLAGVRVQGVDVIRGRPTTTKTRVLSGQQQLVRIDDEDAVAPASRVDRESWDDRVVELLDDGYDALVLSDYAKGVLSDDLCRRLIKRGRERGIPVLVDPKGLDYGKYLGATTITPNETELAATTQVSASNPFELTRVGGSAADLLDLDFVTLTRGEAGISLVEESGTRHVPARAREVFDVSGAGDTAIATLAAGIAIGLDAHDAAVLANLAAGHHRGEDRHRPDPPGPAARRARTRRGRTASPSTRSSSASRPRSQLVSRWRVRGPRGRASPTAASICCTRATSPTSTGLGATATGSSWG